jgi:ribonucleoside-diphosphate reductase alpha chain
MFLDDSACNLASLNLLKFLTSDGAFDVAVFRHAVDIMITAQEILVDNASYPTAKIARNSHDFRPLGLGYANLGALLMANGLAYDSDAGRDYAAAITALMHGQAYLTSSWIARAQGPFPGYKSNQDSFGEVIGRHREALGRINWLNIPGELSAAVVSVWDECVSSGIEHGYRNAQVTVLAPTGTIAFMMDCNTTGIEPDLALVKYKRLVGGGLIKIVNNVVPVTLLKLGYNSKQAAEIVDHIDQHGTIEGSSHVKDEHLPIFDCSLKPANGGRSIPCMGHIRMMAAVQPFLSGAISKTVNMPEEATPEEIANVYQEAWRLGLKAIAIYRDGSKRSQPLSTAPVTKSRRSEAKDGFVVSARETAEPMRRRLPDERKAIVHHFSVGGHEGYLMVGVYEDGQPGEIFIRMAKAGSTVAGLTDSFGIAVSLALQYGVSLKVLCDKFSHTRFEPSGWSGVKEIGYAKSIMDYIARWLALRFLPPTFPLPTGAEVQAPAPAPAHLWADGVSEAGSDGPACRECGAIMSRNGSCYRCWNCGWTSGCS